MLWHVASFCSGRRGGEVGATVGPLLAEPVPEDVGISVGLYGIVGIDGGFAMASFEPYIELVMLFGDPDDELEDEDDEEL
jgi:hypothetical protein